MVKNDKRKVGTAIKVLLCRYKNKFVLLHSMKTCEGVAVHFASRARLYGFKDLEIAGPHTANRAGEWTAVANNIREHLDLAPSDIHLFPFREQHAICSRHQREERCHVLATDI